MSRIFQSFLIFIVVPLLFFLFSCREEPFDLSSDVRLEFSRDSILFDTVFTTVGSSTQWLVVHNHHNRSIIIDRIRLASGAVSVFRFNADGRSGPDVRNLEIAPNDSIFLFVEVTIDPTPENLPFIVSDSLEFTVNSQKQFVNLTAWGQNAHFIHPNVFDPQLNIRYHLISESTTWTDTLPYVIFGLAVVDRGATLSIRQGTQIHMHNNSSLVFLGGASLKVEGTLENPVVFQGDRHEVFFDNLPGQWGRIWLSAMSKDHDINFAIIKNGTVGLQVDSIGSTLMPTLRIRNTVIKNKSLIGLLARGSNVVAENLVVANCGQHLLLLALGGTYEFRHSTFANYFNLPGGTARRTSSVVFNNYYMAANGSLQYRPFHRILFSNSIIFGNLAEEIHADLQPGTTLPVVFDHSLLRSSNPLFRPSFVNVLLNLSPQFNNASLMDFRLRANSPAIRTGNSATGLAVPFDLLGRERAMPPDMGAYQFHPIEEN